MVLAFWSVSTGFLSGVFLGSFYFAWALVGLCVVLAAALFFFPRALLLSFFFLAVGLGLIRMGSASLVFDPALDQQLGEKVVIEGTVFAEPDVREKSTRLFVRTESGVGVLIVAPLHVGIVYGDVIRAEGRLA